MNKRAAIYARVSTQEQADNGNSIDIQIEKLTTYAKLHDYKIVDTYIDAGVSGDKFNRPELDRLKLDVDKIDIVLIYKLDRLSRSIKDTMLLIEDLFKPNNIDLVSISENFDTSQAIGMATVGMLSTFAQLERDTIRDRMIAGKIQSVKNGNYINHPPFGYKKVNGKLVKDERTRECIEFIFKKLLDGYSTSHIAKILEFHKYSELKKSFWHFNTVNKIARQKVYCGHTLLMNIEVKNTHEPYINDEEHDKIVSMLEERNCYKSKGKNKSYYALFRGLISCPTCHRRLAVSRQKIKGEYKNHYRCIYCKRSGKFAPTISEKKVLDKLIDYLNNYSFDVGVENKNQNKTIVINYDKELDIITKKRSKIQRAWLNDLISDDELEKYQNELDNALNDINKMKKQQEDAIKRKNNKIKFENILLNFNKVWEVLNYEERAEFLNTFIISIHYECSKIKKFKSRTLIELGITEINFK
ncbi:recombinase family protein [Gemella sp. Musashino-2025]